MLKDNNQLIQLINDVKENKSESLNLLHYHFSSFIKKYAYKYQVDITTLEAEFDLILLYIINKNITDPKSIIKYIMVCFNNFNNINIDKVLQKDKNLSFVNFEECSGFLSISSEHEFEFDDYPRLSKLLSPSMIEILEEKYIDKLSCKDIGELNNLSKQRISQKIIKAKNEIENNLLIN